MREKRKTQGRGEMRERKTQRWRGRDEGEKDSEMEGER